MEKHDNNYFSMDGDEEIVEEEFVERDEEYDDGYEDEEEYDDGEEGYDEEYDDGYEDEGDYDDGYNDDYYDDRLNKVLDEIAEIKRGIAPSGNGNMPMPQVMPPQYVYQPTAPPAGSEVVMYNEISRLRDELAKNQSSLEMQKELTRMKEDMMRDQKFAESQYNAEIKRLQDKIEDLLKNGSGPQGELPAPQEQAHLKGAETLDFGKLLSINEAVLRTAKESDTRIRGEMEQIKKQLGAFPSTEEISRAVSAVQSATSESDGASAEVLSKLAGEIASLRSALDEKSKAVPAPAVTVINSAGDGGAIDSSELLRQLYSIKNIVGSSSEETVKRTRAILELVSEYKKLSASVRSQTVSYKDKLTAVYAYAKRLSDANDPDAVDLAEATERALSELKATAVTRSVFADLVSYCSENSLPLITQTMRDSAERYFGLCEKAVSATTDDLGNFLPDLLAEKNKLENNRNESANNAVFNGITNALLEENRDAEAIADSVEEFIRLNVENIVDLPFVSLPKQNAVSSESGESLFDKLSELKNTLTELTEIKSALAEIKAKSESAAAAPAETVAPVQTEAAPSQPQLSASDLGAAVNDVNASVGQAADRVLTAVNELKESLKASSSQTVAQAEAVRDDSEDKFDDIVEALAELRGNYLDVSQKLIDISSKIVSSSEEEKPEQVLTEEDKQKVIEDLRYIHSKLDEYELFINQIGELRTDILNVSSAIDLTSQFDHVINEISTHLDNNLSESASQFDKLYEDISNVLIESEANIINRIGEPTFVIDAVDAAKSEILAETQALKDSLYVVTDAVTASPVNDAVEQLRGDLSALSDLSTANAEIATSERQKIMDDVAFLREQAEYAIADNETAVSGSGEKLYTYLDEISAQVNQLGVISQDTAATKEAVNTVIDNTVTLLDAVAAINFADDLAAVKENSSATLDAVMPLSDTIVAVNDSVTVLSSEVAETLNLVRPIADDVVSARDAATAALDALAPISEQINAILDRLDADSVVEFDDATAQGDGELNDELAEIRDGLNTVLDTFPLMPQSDDVITARDNTYSILDALTAMPHTDDMVTTRDNVAAILDAVTALTDSVAALSEQSTADVSQDIADLRANTDTIASDISALISSGENIAALKDALDSRLTAAEETNNEMLSEVREIKQKLEDAPQSDIAVADTLANIMEDLGAMLDKLEAFEQNAVVDKQELLDAVSGIREEVHISELNETMTAAGIDDETRDSLVTEIAEIRERLSNIDEVTQSTNDNNAAALENIAAQLADLQNAVAARSAEDGVATDGSTLGVLDEINAKLDLISGGVTLDGSENISENVELIKDYILGNPSAVDALAADIADIKARLDGGATSALSDENIQALIDELAVIKEKIDAEADYDTVAEILSLRDDVKAARIVDQNDVSGELESIKNELAAISSGNILDEIRALREEVAVIAGGGISDSGLSAPTDGELNLVLNEIVSLRDEMFAFKDEVLSATSVSGEQATETPIADSGDEINIILDEITALRADQSVLTGNIDELKDIVSRRTTLSAADTEGEETSAQSNELNVVLDEIINLKNDLERAETAPSDELLVAISEQVEDLRASLEELRTGSAQSDALSSDIAEIKEAIENISNTAPSVDLTDIATRLDELSLAVSEISVHGGTQDTDGERVISSSDAGYSQLRSDIDELKAVIGDIAAPQDVVAEIADLRAEIAQLRADNERLRQENADSLSGQLAELREAVRDMALASAPVQTADGDTSYAALIEEIRDLKEQVAESKQSPATVGDDILQEIRDILSVQVETPTLADAVNEIRDELASLRNNGIAANASAASEEVAAMRNELAELKEMFAASPDSLFGLAEDVTSIRADVQTLKEEPDLGVINEILALRDEFQNLREQIEDVKRIAGQTDTKSDETLLNEVQSLRDQLFAISMANVSDSASGETNYESYNNIILDEIASLRDQVDAVGTSDGILAVSEDIAQLKAALDERAEQYDDLAHRVALLDGGDTDKKILGELADLRTELANQRDADMTTLNFMSEMAHLLERQNQYLTENSESKLSDEIESLKAELASTDSVAEEVAKLREIMTQAGNASDNETILNELADLREELGNEKPSRENELILQEIARLRDEITALTDRDQRYDASVGRDAELSDSLSDLKTQLNEIAGIIEPESAPEKKQTAKSGAKSSGRSASNKSGGSRSSSKSASSKSGGKSTGTKSTGAKRGRKPAQKATVNADTAAESSVTSYQSAMPITTDIDKRIDEQMSSFVGTDEFSLNPLDLTTGDTMDVADKLAQQVANKLVMEQLVEQLGDGGVSDDRVDEILREILPQEFTTVAMTEQSDKVRRLANQLVLNKLRDRLRGKAEDDE